MHSPATIDERLDRLARQRFRAKFHLHEIPKGHDLTPDQRAW